MNEDPPDRGAVPASAPPAPIVTYSLEQVAAMVLPADWKDAERWLGRKLQRNEISGYKVSRGVWRMTHADVEDFIARHRSTPPPIPEPKAVERETYPGSLTRRSWQNLQRGRPKRTPYRGPKVEHDKVRPPPSSFVKVHPESPEVIAAMPPLTETQMDILKRVQTEGEIVFSGKTAKKTVEALARRGLVDYDAEYALNEKHLYYAYRFTVRPKPAT